MTTPQKIIGFPPAEALEFIFVYGSLRTGGIETLIVRMANFLVSQGVPVSIYCAQGGELRSLLTSGVSFVEAFSSADLVKDARAYVSSKGIDTNILIISFDPISAARALMIETGLPKWVNAVHISGVYHPRAYFMKGERIDRIVINFLIACAVGKRQLFFMNAECRRSHSVRWGTDLSESSILALPINQVDQRWRVSDRSRVRVISVGRLVLFKKYNIGAAKIVKSCLDRGIEVTWDIFGEGLLKESIQAEIEASGVSEHVRLMGTLDYRDYSERVAGYDIFVGMGTAALEAAMLGVPTICATVDEDFRCYGYLHELPFGNVGEVQEVPPLVELSDLIEQYSKAGRQQREHLSLQSRMTAEMYGMPKFVEEIISMVSSKNPTPSRIFKRLVAELYQFMTESFLVKIFRGYKSSLFRP